MEGADTVQFGLNLLRRLFDTVALAGFKQSIQCRVGGNQQRQRVIRGGERPVVEQAGGGRRFAHGSEGRFELFGSFSCLHVSHLVISF